MSSASAGPPRPTIYVCDPSAEATRTESALAHAGYEVVDVPKQRLLERVRLQRPAAIVLDVVDEGSLALVPTLRGTSGGEAIHVLFVAVTGGPLRDAEDALMRDGSGLFLRPVDPAALVRKIEALVGPGDTHRDRQAQRSRQNVQHAPDDLPSGRSLDAAIPPSVVREQALPEIADDIRALLAAADARAAALDLSGATPPLDGDSEIDVVLGGDDLAGIAPGDEDNAQDRGSDDGRLLTSGALVRSGKSDDERVITQTPLQVAKQRRTTSGAPTGGTTGFRSSTSPGVEVSQSQFARYADSPARSLRDAALATPNVPNTSREAPLTSSGPAASFLTPSTPPATPMEHTVPPRAPESSDDVPPNLTRDLAPELIAALVRRRASGVLTFAHEGGSRSLTLRDGDFSSVQSTYVEDGLLPLLERRGFLEPDALPNLTLSSIPRLACAALVARGYLAQDDLWPVLRLHGEHVLASMLSSDRGVVTFVEGSVAEDGASPFGAFSGSAIFVRAFCMGQNVATFGTRAGRRAFQLVRGDRFDDRIDAVGDAGAAEDVDRYLNAVIDAVTADELGPALVTLEALAHLGILTAVDRIGGEHDTPAPVRGGEAASIDADALRQRIGARRRLVDEGDYFSLLGVSPRANGFEIRQAYLELRRAFEPARVLQFAELHAFEGDVRTILEVVEEAYLVLRDDARRERYRKAIGAS